MREEVKLTIVPKINKIVCQSRVGVKSGVETAPGVFYGSTRDWDAIWIW